MNLKKLSDKVHYLQAVSVCNTLSQTRENFADRNCTAVDYGASVIVAKPTHTVSQIDDAEGLITDTIRQVSSKPELATHVKLGMRMPSFKILNQADARPWHFQEILKSNGCWRIVLLAGDVTQEQQMMRIRRLCERFSSSGSFLQRFTPAGARYDATIEVLTLHSAPRTDFTVFDFPEVLRPYDDRDGWDYWKLYVDDLSYHEGHGRAYESYGVDPRTGCAIILRPDQYVSWIGEVDDYASMDEFFSGFMIEQKGTKAEIGNGNVLH